MGIMVYSSLWVMQDLCHQPYRVELRMLGSALRASQVYGPTLNPKLGV